MNAMKKNDRECNQEPNGTYEHLQIASILLLSSNMVTVKSKKHVLENGRI